MRVERYYETKNIKDFEKEPFIDVYTGQETDNSLFFEEKKIKPNVKSIRKGGFWKIIHNIIPPIMCYKKTKNLKITDF